MSTTTAQVQFAAEFVTLMVAAAGVALAILRGRPARAGGSFATPAEASVLNGVSRALAVLAFVVAGTASFLSGSLLVTGHAQVMGVARIVSAALLLASLAGWEGGARSRYLLIVGAAGWAAAGLAQIGRASVPVVEVLLAAGSVAVGVALVSSSRSSVAARLAAGAATTLLLVVLVVAVALSEVISSSLEHTELVHLGQQAQTYATQVSLASEVAQNNAALIAGDLQGTFRSSSPNPLIVLGSAPPAGVAQATAQIEARLSELSHLSHVSIFYESPAATVVPGAGATPAVSPVLAAALAQGIRAPSASCSPAGGFVRVAGVVWAAESYPVCSGSNVLGRQYAAVPLDDAFLTNLGPPATISLGLVSPGGVDARTRSFTVPAASLRGLVTQSGGTAQVGDQFVAVVPLRGVPSLALATATPSASVFSTRHQLFRTLFLIALGGTVLALGLAIFIGDRITGGLRRLTSVAARIQAGNASERAEIAGDDEVAVLGSAFDSMLDSLESQTTALQAAADDETRLRNRLEAVVGGMGDALIAIDSTGRITDFNRAAEELIGVGAESALGRPVERVVDVVQENGEPLGRRLAKPSRSPWGRVGLVGNADGDRIPVALSAGGLRGPQGEVIGSVVVLRDLRSEREVERMKTEFLSRVGHELRTPLTGIMGYADILLRREVSAEQARMWHEEILQAGRRLLRIVEMLEFFASSGAGKVLLRPESLDTKTLVRGITSSWSERVPSNVTIGRHVSSKTPPVLADRHWLALAIEELLDNAVKFSPEGGRVVVSAGPAIDGPSENGLGVQISVVDRGIGMTAGEHSDLFGEFVQGDGSDTRRFGGLGLGLAVVQRVVQGHGGTVECRSAPGRGTTFTMYLPRAPQDNGAG